MNGAREFDLLVRQVAVRIFGKLLAENQNAVERRPQLVRHVGKELGFVLRCQRKFGRLLFERSPRLLDFLILAFHFKVSFGKLLGFLLKLVVCLLQLSLLRLQFSGELLGLLQQTFGLHRRLNAVEYNADAIRKLLKKRHLRRSE